MPELDLPQRPQIDILLNSDPLDDMTFDELQDLRERINKAILRKTIRDSIDRKKALQNASNN